MIQCLDLGLFALAKAMLDNKPDSSMSANPLLELDSLLRGYLQYSRRSVLEYEESLSQGVLARPLSIQINGTTRLELA